MDSTNDPPTSGQNIRSGRPVRSWPVWLLATPAFVAVWSGWVGLGGLTGFGVVHPLPGIWDAATLNTAITLPVGMETYAAFAIRVWLSEQVPAAARRFARWSVIGSLMLGAAGQVTYHLLVAFGIAAAPWPITAVVACLPVGVLGMGAALAHLLRDQPPQNGVTTARAERGEQGGQIALSADSPRTGIGPSYPPAADPAPQRPAPEDDAPGAPLDGGQVPDSPRTDTELLAELRPVWNAFAPLSRYRVEQLTGAGARQAQRLLDILAAERTDDGQISSVTGQAGQIPAVNGARPNP